ncbi:MAG TPA: hypothetical protein VD948_02905 [Rhodothermales bacterium]|nr:hypothetical protein [Rhodothermales bacterium]
MISAEKLAERLDGARFVRFDADSGTVFAWKGGRTINLYSLAGGEDVASMDYGEEPTLERAQACIERLRTDY